MSFYVRRTRVDTGRDSFTGPIRSANQAHREATAWNTSTREWVAVVEPSTPALRAEVRAWEKAKPMTGEAPTGADPRSLDALEALSRELLAQICACLDYAAAERWSTEPCPEYRGALLRQAQTNLATLIAWSDKLEEQGR